jgi:integrase
MATRTSRSKGTRSSYGSYVKWAHARALNAGIDMSRPLKELDLMMLTAFHAREKIMGSCSTMMSALAAWHHDMGFGDLPRGLQYKRCMRGLKNITAGAHETERALALTVQDLRAIHAKMNPSSFEHARDWAMFSVAFFFLLRSGEYTESVKKRTLQWGDVQLDNPNQSMDLTIRFSKGSNEPVTRSSCFRRDFLCPARSITAYGHAHHKWFGGNGRRPTDNMFVTAAGTPMTQKALGFRLGLWLQRIGLPKGEYSPHSFRRGGATAMFMAGIPISIISHHGRWASDAIHDYNDFRVAKRKLEATRSLLAL